MPTYTPSNTPYQARNLNEMLVPLAKYAEVAGEYEKQTDDYLNRLATLRAFMPEDDVEMAKTLKEAEDAYNDAWGRIQSNGLSLNDKNSYRTAHALYRDKVVPYHAAMEAREAVRKAHEANMANRDVRYQTGKGPNDYNISAYLHGNRPEIAFVQGENVAKDANAMMKGIQSGTYTRGSETYKLTKQGIYGLQKEIDTFVALMNSDNPADREKARKIGNEYIHGKKRDPNADGPLYEIYRQLQDKYGINESNFSDEARSYLNNQIILGMKSAPDGADVYESKMPKTPTTTDPKKRLTIDDLLGVNNYNLAIPIEEHDVMKSYKDKNFSLKTRSDGTSYIGLKVPTSKGTNYSISIDKFIDKDGKLCSKEYFNKKMNEIAKEYADSNPYSGNSTHFLILNSKAGEWSGKKVGDKWYEKMQNFYNNIVGMAGKENISSRDDFMAHAAVGTNNQGYNSEQTRTYRSDYVNLGNVHLTAADVKDFYSKNGEKTGEGIESGDHRLLIDWYHSTPYIVQGDSKAELVNNGRFGNLERDMNNVRNYILAHDRSLKYFYKIRNQLTEEEAAKYELSLFKEAQKIGDFKAEITMRIVDVLQKGVKRDDSYKASDYLDNATAEDFASYYSE